MANKRPQWQLHTLAAQKRELERQRAEQKQKVAHYFDVNTKVSKHYEQWTTEGYYERANKEAELLGEKKIKAVKLEERRKKLELMLFQENMQLQQELKTLTTQPKFFKNGSYLNSVPTSTLKDINQGIMDKEQDARRQEAELRLYHAWRMNQPELRAAHRYMQGKSCKSAWMEQIVEKEAQKKKEEMETRKILLERDEMVRKQIQDEEEKLKEKEKQIKELRNSLEGQISELSEKEKYVNKLRIEEERQRNILEELQYIRREREREHKRLASERDAHIINMGLYKYRMKQRVLAVLKEIQLDLDMLEKAKRAIVKDAKEEENRRAIEKKVLDAAYAEMIELRERERQRQKAIDSMYDGEARQMNEKQDKMWEKERVARALLMEEVLKALQKQLEEQLEMNRQKQRQNVLERENILDQVDSFHKEVKNKESEKQFQNTAYGNINNLQSQLNSLKLKQKELDERASREASVREGIARERELRQELVKMQKEGSKEFYPRNI